MAFLFGCLNGLKQTSDAVLDEDRKRPWLLMYGSIASRLIADIDVNSLESMVALKGVSRYELKLQRDLVFSPYRPDPAALAYLRQKGVEPIEAGWLADLYNILINSTEAFWNEMAIDLSRKIVAAMDMLDPGKEPYTAKAQKKSVLLNLWVLMLHGLSDALDRKLFFLGPNPDASLYEDKDGDRQEEFDDYMNSLSPDLLPAAHKQVFVAVLDAYLDYCVGKAPVKPIPASHTSPRLPTDCCLDCDSVNAFLDDEVNLTTILHKLKKRRRVHIHQMMEQHGVDCQHETTLWPSPPILTLKKWVSSYPQDLAEWEKRKAAADKVLEEFSSDALQAYLGDDYDRIMNMDRLTDPKLLPEPNMEFNPYLRYRLSSAEASGWTVSGNYPAESDTMAAAEESAAEVVAPSDVDMGGPAATAVSEAAIPATPEEAHGTKRKADDGLAGGPNKKAEI